MTTLTEEKDKNCMILSTGQGKASGNIQRSFIAKTLWAGILNSIRDILEKNPTLTLN